MRWPAVGVDQEARALHLLKGVSFELSNARSEFSEPIHVDQVVQLPVDGA